MTIDWSDASGCRVGSCEPPVGLPTSWLAPSGLSRSVSPLFRDRSEYPVLRCRFPEGWRQSGLPEWAADVGSCGPSENPNAVSLNVALVSLSPEPRPSLGALSVASPILSTMNRTPVPEPMWDRGAELSHHVRSGGGAPGGSRTRPPQIG